MLQDILIFGIVLICFIYLIRLYRSIEEEYRIPIALYCVVALIVAGAFLLNDFIVL